MAHENKSPARIIAETMTRLYENGMTTTSGGNLSIMDDNGSLWISPSGIDKAHLEEDDIMRVDPDGSVHGKHRPSTEYPFHLAILRARPDLKAVLHAHPAALVAFSLARLVPFSDILPDTYALCGKTAIAKYALPGSSLLGSYISEKFAQGYNTVMLENHGVVLGASSLTRAYMMLEAYDFSARAQIVASTLHTGDIRRLGEGASVQSSIPFVHISASDTIGETEAKARAEIVEFSHRCHKNKLFSAAFGVIAARVGENSFVISPDDSDPSLICAADAVLIENGRVVGNGIPSAYAPLASKIFAAQKDVSCVIFARPPYVSGFAVCDAVFDSHLIPEGYICLKNVTRYKYGAVGTQPDVISAEMTMKTPIALIENDCAAVAGTSVLNAYDRLEVMEFGARSLCHIAALGTVATRISEEEIKEIETAFKL